MNKLNVHSRQAGFSLIEAVVVLAIVATVLAVVPAASGFAPETQINRVAGSLADDLRAARSLAVKYGNDFIVAFDPANGIVSTYNDKSGQGAIPSQLVRQRTLNSYGGGAVFQAATTTGIDGNKITAAVVMGGTSNPIAVTFHANGSASNSGVAYLMHSTDARAMLARSVAVLATGVVQTWKYNGGWIRWI